MSDLSKFRAEQLQDPEFREHYIQMQAAADFSKAIIAGRLEKDLTQQELSRLTGIPQADISRFERCEGNPSLKTMNKLAAGLGLTVRIELVPAESALTGPEA